MLLLIHRPQFLPSHQAAAVETDAASWKIVFGAAADAKRNVRVLRQLTQPEDHPINIFHPEGEYLKGLLLHVE